MKKAQSTQISYQFSDKISIDWLVQNLPQFLFPDLSKQKNRIEKPFIGVIATHHRQPVGLILATAESTQKIYRIHSFLVHPQFHQQGIGTTLLKKLTTQIKSRGGVKIESVYRSHWKSVPAIRQLLAKSNWEVAQPQLVIAKGAITNALYFFTRSTPILSNFSISPFTHLKKSDLFFIQKQQTDYNWFDSSLHPFLEQPSIRMDSSFLIKKEEKVIGWIVSHQLTADLLEWTSLFIDPNFRSFSLTYALIKYAFEQQQRLGIAQFLVTSKVDGNAVVKLMQRAASAYGVFYTTTFYSCKNIGI